MLVCPHSGLGNQIGNYVFFEYLIFMKLLKRSDVKLLITKDETIDRTYMLDKFNLDINLAGKEDIEEFLKGKTSLFSYGILAKNILFNKKTYFNSLYKVLKRIRTEYKIFPSKTPSLLSKVVSYKDVLRYGLCDGVVCDCYSPIKEFNDVEFRNSIKEQFRLREELDKDNKEVLERIKSYKNSVGVHIRRGDFINMKIPVVRREYLIRNIEYLRKRFNDEGVHFFVFSNGIEWARENLSCVKDIDFIDINSENKGYLDFILMNNTHHRIYSPSSFSSWLRYLNPYEESVEIIPGEGDVGVEA